MDTKAEIMERSIPNELLIELWSRISLTKLPTMRLVSKNWKDLIDSSANFIASKQPRIFCTYLTYDGERRIRSVPQNHVYPNDGRWECFRFPRYRPEVFSQPVNGLIGVRAQGITNECLIQINNFFTGKSLYLPSLPQKFYYGDTSFFLGCLTSPLLFKVLCVRVEKTPDEVLVMPQICSVKGKSLSWREISCKDPHFPINSKPGMCKDGVIYYAAWNVNSELFVMSFNLETEVFSPIYLGVITRNDFMSIRMMDYNGDVSLVISQPTPRGTNDVSQDIHVKMQQGWRSTQFKIRRYSPLQECPLFFNGNSELVLAPTEIDYPLKWRQQKLKFEKAELGYRLWFYKNGEDFRSQYYDEFTDRLTDRGRVDVEFFVGTASFIIPKELLE